MRQLSRAVQAVFLDENGQVMTEYVLVTVFIALTALVFTRFFPPAIRAYLAKFYAVVSLPIP